MVADRDQTLEDAIYEAAAVPELWPSVLDRVSRDTRGVGGFLFAVRDSYVRAISSDNLISVRDALMDGGVGAREPRLPRARQLNYPGFLNDQDLFTDEEIATNDVYETFYRKHGVGCVAGTLIPNPTGDSLVFAFQYDHRNGPVPRSTVTFLDGLRPHLARASMLSFRLGLQRARGITDALQLLGLPGVVLRESGAPMSANAGFNALVPGVVLDRHARLHFGAAGADRLFANALARFQAGLARQSSVSIAIPAADDHPAMVAHLMPVEGVAHDVFNNAALILVFTPVDRAAVPTADVLQGLFDLSPAEARVAQKIGHALSVDEVATAQGVSRETVRSQLKAVLAKTGLSRQSELVRLLAGTALA